MIGDTEPTGEATETGNGSSDAAVEAVAFLARSEHRVRVLELLAERARTRTELTDATGATRVTLSRVLGDLEDRGWIRRPTGDGGYALTDLGELVFADFRRLLGTVSVGQRYPDIVERLSTDWFGFELRHLADADLVASESADLLSAARAVATAIGRAETVRAVVGTFTSLPMHTHAEALREGQAADAEVVFDAEATAVGLDDPEVERRWRRIERESDSPVYYSVDDRIPCNVDLVDGETVYLSVGGAAGGFSAVRTDHPAVVEWARECFERKRAAAVPLERKRADEEPVADA